MSFKKALCYQVGHKEVLVKCDTVYINDVVSANEWIKRHDDVFMDYIEHGYEYYSKDGGHMFDITDFDKITITMEGDVEVWHVE